MKFVYLIMYLWHFDGSGYWASGGPSHTITPMPSILVCERTGAAAKAFVDGQHPASAYAKTFNVSPSQYICVEVDDKPTTTPPKCSP